MTQIENSQIKQLSDRIEEQGHKIQEKNSEISEMKMTVDRIEKALLGDKFNEHGIIKRLESVEQKQDEMNLLLTKYKWTWSGLVTVLVSISGIFAFVYYLSSIVKNLFK